MSSEIQQRVQVNVVQPVEDSFTSTNIGCNVVRNVKPCASNEGSFVDVVNNDNQQLNVNASSEASEATTTSPNKRKMLRPRKLQLKKQQSTNKWQTNLIILLLSK